MMDKNLPDITGSRGSGYFTSHDLLLIGAIAILAFLTGTFGLNRVLPGGSPGGFAHGFLVLPGPGAGVFFTSAVTCLWLVLGLLLIRKTGTAIAIAAIVMSLCLAGSLAGFRMIRVDYLAVMAALIIECSGLLPIDRKPWSHLFPSFLAILGVVTLALMLTGNAKTGENGAAATVFPIGYAVTGILALALAIIVFSFPSAKYIAGAGCAEIFYLVFSWMYAGKTGFGSWLPIPIVIPPVLAFACVCGAFMAVLAYGIAMLMESYTQTKPAVR